mmetsp:Transcript_18401/g.41901  ORF Transcript_18401/g.41901 Transcript_18401/m.41901 type:complete len:268 (+) Transcript_18401:1579-2382(+)
MPGDPPSHTACAVSALVPMLNLQQVHRTDVTSSDDRPRSTEGVCGGDKLRKRAIRSCSDDAERRRCRSSFLPIQVEGVFQQPCQHLVCCAVSSNRNDSVVKREFAVPQYLTRMPRMLGLMTICFNPGKRKHLRDRLPNIASVLATGEGVDDNQEAVEGHATGRRTELHNSRRENGEHLLQALEVSSFGPREDIGLDLRLPRRHPQHPQENHVLTWIIIPLEQLLCGENFLSSKEGAAPLHDEFRTTSRPEINLSFMNAFDSRMIRLQ